MFGSFAIFGVCVLCFVSWGHCDTIAFDPTGISYSWIIPPSGAHQSQSQSSSADRPKPPADIDTRNESPITQAPTPVGGYGHPPFYLRHSHEQLTLPNEFLITPLDPQPRMGSGPSLLSWSHPPLFQQLDTEQQHATTMQMHQSNIAPVASIAQERRADSFRAGGVGIRQPVSWPSGGSIGLLFFVPDSASHLPVEQLIGQQLLLPFDISINCNDATATTAIDGVSRCLSGGTASSSAPKSTAASTTMTFDGNGNYASPPLFDIVNSSGRSQYQRKWRTLGERIVRNKHHHPNRQQQQQQQQQQ